MIGTAAFACYWTGRHLQISSHGHHFIVPHTVYGIMARSLHGQQYQAESHTHKLIFRRWNQLCRGYR